MGHFERENPGNGFSKSSVHLSSGKYTQFRQAKLGI